MWLLLGVLEPQQLGQLGDFQVFLSSNNDGPFVVAEVPLAFAVAELGSSRLADSSSSGAESFRQPSAIERAVARRASSSITTTSMLDFASSSAAS